MGRAKEVLSKRNIFRAIIMIFVTVGTHEQPFDRLIVKVDQLKGLEKIKDTVFIQTGYSLYKPQNCEYSQFLKFREIMDFIKKASIIITHGGPGSIFPIFYYQKVPIVVPRMKRYGEHVDDHQVYFCKRLERDKRIIPIYDIEDLEKAISNYHAWVKLLRKETDSETASKICHFARSLDEICNKMIKRIEK